MVIVIETIFPEIGNVQIFPTIVIVIARADPLAPSRGQQASLCGDIREGGIMIVVIQVVGGSLFGGKPFERGSFTTKISGHPSLS